MNGRTLVCWVSKQPASLKRWYKTNMCSPAFILLIIFIIMLYGIVSKEKVQIAGSFLMMVGKAFNISKKG